MSARGKLHGQDFNPRSREGSDKGSFCFNLLFSQHFNPRSREGSDTPPPSVCMPLQISTHAPARGATISSIPASLQNSYFNPRSREGSDFIFCLPFQIFNLISTHAPARGATCGNLDISAIGHISTHAPARGATLRYLLHLLLSVFQPTLPRGERPPSLRNISQPRRFQPTLPRGERPWHPGRHLVFFHFNPRSREGSDAMQLVYKLTIYLFQPTLPRGERLQK